MSDTPNASATPPPLSVAASLVGVEGLGAVGVAIGAISDVRSGQWATAASIAAFFALCAAGLFVAGWALWRRHGWARGPALITQLLMLGIAFGTGIPVAAAIVVAAVAVISVAGIVHPDSIRALSGEAD
ncbi:hypothetical protein F0U44_00550 [Nocardioides humilatus]|uniref:Integral membrane protein n=1 Tax=Nocardioides humilatus TaxID=2607660 RepID=A0A5B1LK83_9ACTN|nr:hypothetical protein [Nocardioides humilatus]KAA1420876.1 hypothetical protein F0U44_00550 [Nocardioides humilatus]